VTGITPTQLAQLLKPFGVSPRNIRLNDGKVVKGYYLDDLTDLFARYLSSPAITPLQRYNPNNSKGYVENETATGPLQNILGPPHLPQERRCSGSVAAPGDREIESNQQSSGAAGKFISKEDSSVAASNEVANVTHWSPSEFEDLRPGQEVELR
jgi:hypothetical protein